MLFLGGLLTDELRYVNVPLMARSECEECMSITEGMVCAGYCGRNDGDSCQVRNRSSIIKATFTHSKYKNSKHKLCATKNRTKGTFV